MPQANRDTLLELLQFLSRVALHSDGIILIDGTEVRGHIICGKEGVGDYDGAVTLGIPDLTGWVDL